MVMTATSIEFLHSSHKPRFQCFKQTNSYLYNRVLTRKTSVERELQKLNPIILEKEGVVSFLKEKK